MTAACLPADRFAALLGADRGTDTAAAVAPTPRSLADTELFREQTRSFGGHFVTVTCYPDRLVLREAATRRARKHYTELTAHVGAAELAKLLADPPHVVARSTPLPGDISLSIVIPSRWEKHRRKPLPPEYSLSLRNGEQRISVTLTETEFGWLQTALAGA